MRSFWSLLFFLHIRCLTTPFLILSFGFQTLVNNLWLSYFRSFRLNFSSMKENLTSSGGFVFFGLLIASVISSKVFFFQYLAVVHHTKCTVHFSFSDSVPFMKFHISFLNSFQQWKVLPKSSVPFITVAASSSKFLSFSTYLC